MAGCTHLLTLQSELNGLIEITCLFLVVGASRWHQDGDLKWTRVTLQSTQATDAMTTFFARRPGKSWIMTWG